MGTREEIQRRGVRPEDVDDIIGVAARLQDEAAADAGGASVREVQDVARELDIDPRYVEAAIAQLERQREEDKAAEEAAAAAAAEIQRQRRRQLGLTGAGLAVLLAVIAAVTGVTAMSGAGDVRDAAAAAQAAAAQLEVVLERQESLAPQLVALAGGQLAGVADLQRRADAAADIGAKLEASAALGQAMAEALGQLPPPPDPASAQLRLNLQHEVVGAQNRITTEQRRYEAALAQWRAEAADPGGRLAVSLGLAPEPPP